MKFETAQQMLEFINEGNDLYSRQAEIYIFSYNDSGSVCIYDIDKNEADRLAKQVNDSNENYYFTHSATCNGNLEEAQLRAWIGGYNYAKGIDERDMKVYRKWHQDRRKRGLDLYWWSTDAERAENENVINGKCYHRSLAKSK